MPSAAKKLLFGTAGVPLSASSLTTLSALDRIRELGLDCLEIEFVKGMKMGQDTALRIREKASACKIGLSVHAPYYVNLSSPEEGKRLLSQEQLLNSARMADMCGAKNVVFHGGYYGRENPEKACEAIKKALQELTSVLRSERSSASLRLETMGKKSQFGSLEEVLFMCREVKDLLPCLDFSHIHAREGKANAYIHFHRIFEKVERKLGERALKNAHIHVSGVDYNEKGELKHIDLQESDFHYDDWIQALKDFEVEGMVICESPNLEQDALMLKKLFY